MSSLQKLIDGFRQFRNETGSDQKREFQGLVEKGQSPKIMLIACVDSRVDPAVITRTSCGDLLVVRNVANLVPPYRTDSHYQSTASALEFAVNNLKVDHVVVMGHSRCGGIMSLLGDVTSNTDPVHPLGEWMQIMETAARETLERLPDTPIEEQACQCSRSALGLSLKNLETYPWIKEALDKDSLKIHGWYFNLDNISLEELNLEDGTFTTLVG